MKVNDGALTLLRHIEIFVMAQTSAPERSRLTSGEESEQEKSWIELNFRKKECSKFIPLATSSTESLSRCGCGRLLSDHLYLNTPGIQADEDLLPLGATAQDFYGKATLVCEDNSRPAETSFVNFTAGPLPMTPKHDHKWNMTQHTSLYPTDAHGTLEFQGTGEGDKSKYIRLSNDTNPDIVLKLLYEEWNLNPPKMVITVHGGAHNFQLQPKLHRVFCNGLIKAAKTTGAWIMTFGLNTGVGMIVGDALKEHKARSRGKIVSVGVAPWGVVDHREDLVGSEQISSYQTMENPLSKGSVLHTAHTHFLLVDNGTEGRFDSELRFRRQLELRFSHQFLHPREGRTSVVCLVLEGGKNTINVVLESVRQTPPIPVIICDGSGRAADLLSFAHQYVDEDGTMMEELKVQLLALIQDTFKCSRDQAQYFYMSIMECVKKKDLITIFRMSKGYTQDDIDIAILTATLKAQCTSAPDMLKLALSWNRIDIATSQIFVYGRQWPVLSMEQAMMDALIQDRVDFVKLLMENGVSMHKFLTVSRLEELYNAKPPVNLVYLINDVKKNIPPGYRFTLIDIGQVIELLMGGAYRSSYTRKRFRLHYASKAKAEQSVKKQLSFRMGFNTSAMPKSPSTQVLQMMEKIAPDPPQFVPPHFAYPFHELLMWAVLMKRQKMAHFMWQQGEEAIAKALIASKLYKMMAKEAADDDLDVEESDQLRSYSKDFQDLAIQLLEICYHADDDATQHLLTYELKQWSRETCLSLAVSAKHRDFIAHPCVQLLLNDLWMGGLNERKNSGLKVIMGILIPPTLLTLDFKTQEELQLMPQTMEEHMHEVSSLPSSIAGSSSSSSSQSSSSSSSSDKTAASLPKPEVLGKPVTDKLGQDAYVILTNRPRQIPLSKKIYEFYNAPITKFWMHAMAYVCILMLFTYVVLVRMDRYHPSIPEWIVISHVITITMEKVREIVVSEPSGTVQKLKVWMSHFWNGVDALTIVTFFIGFGMRLSSSLHVFKVGRTLYCLNIVLWYTHLLNVFSVNKRLGPNVTLMGKMMVDLATFIVLLAVVLTSFGVARQSLLRPNETASWLLLKNVTLEPYFMLYGEVYAGTIDPCYGEDKTLCVTGAWLAPVLMTVYLLVANILLLNLLIAVFNNTFSRVKNYSDRIWKFQRYLTIVEYELRPVLPPPLILISYFFMIIRRVCKKRKNAPSDRGLKLFLDVDDVEKLHDFEEDCVDEYFRRKMEQDPKNGNNKREERLDRLLDSVEEFCQRESVLTNHLLDMHERLAALEEAHIKLLEMQTAAGLSSRSRWNTGGQSDPWTPNDPRLELAPLPETNPPKALWSFRSRMRKRQDSEMSTVSDWPYQIANRARTVSQDRTKPGSKTDVLPVEVDQSLRRTNSTGVLQSKATSVEAMHPIQHSGMFRPSDNIAVQRHDSKSLSCQDIMMLGTNKAKSALDVVDGCDVISDTSLDQSSRTTLDESLPTEFPKPCLTNTDSDVVSADSRSDVMFTGVADKSSQDTLLDNPVTAVQSSFTFPSEEVSNNSRDLSSSSHPMFTQRLPPDEQTPKTSIASNIPRNRSFDTSLGTRKYLVATPSVTIQPSPTSKSTYKSITDQIDTSSWHEMYAPPVPCTPLDGWWSGKSPDFDSYRPIKFSDQTSLVEFDEDTEQTDKKKGRAKSKPPTGRHRKRRNKKTLSGLPEVPSVNANNNASETVVSQTSTFPRSRPSSSSEKMTKSKSQTFCDANATIA